MAEKEEEETEFEKFELDIRVILGGSPGTEIRDRAINEKEVVGLKEYLEVERREHNAKTLWGTLNAIPDPGPLLTSTMKQLMEEVADTMESAGREAYQIGQENKQALDRLRLLLHLRDGVKPEHPGDE